MDGSINYARVCEMRMAWAPRIRAVAMCVAEPLAVPGRQYSVARAEVCGIHFQRCGGGVRVVRKRIGRD